MGMRCQVAKAVVMLGLLVTLFASTGHTRNHVTAEDFKGGLRVMQRRAVYLGMDIATLLMMQQMTTTDAEHCIVQMEQYLIVPAEEWEAAKKRHCTQREKQP